MLSCDCVYNLSWADFANITQDLLCPQRSLENLCCRFAEFVFSWFVYCCTKGIVWHRLKVNIAFFITLKPKCGKLLGRYSFFVWLGKNLCCSRQHYRERVNGEPRNTLDTGFHNDCWQVLSTISPCFKETDSSKRHWAGERKVDFWEIFSWCTVSRHMAHCMCNCFAKIWAWIVIQWPVCLCLREEHALTLSKFNWTHFVKAIFSHDQIKWRNGLGYCKTPTR